MEEASPSERVAAVGRDDARKSASVRDGIGVDGEREHQQVCEDEPQCQSAEACTFLVRGPHLHLKLTAT